MPFFEVYPSDDTKNPYRVTVASPNDFYDGNIRIEPPFTPSLEYLRVLSTEEDVKVRDALVGQEATTLSFEMSGEESILGHSHQERIERTIKILIEELGHVANKELFLESLS